MVLTTAGQVVYPDTPLTMGNDEKVILRELAHRVAAIAAKPGERAKAARWTCHNRLERGKPMVLTYPDVSWGELVPEASLATGGFLARKYERDLRMRIYAHEHWNDDNVVEPVVFYDLAITDTGPGISTQVAHPSAPGGAHRFLPVILDEGDIERIGMPVLSVDLNRSDEARQIAEDTFGGILAVEKRGINQVWCAMIDTFIQWRGIENLMLDIHDRPDWLHAVMRRLTDGWLARIDQAERLHLFTLAIHNEYVGSGGLAYTSELPAQGFGTAVRARDLWGQATTQIFSTVSPDTHEEFAVAYERQILERFGLNCYGCCEPLHTKVEQLKGIKRLRRVSMSPWVDIAAGAAALGNGFIFSSKPNPELVTRESFHPDQIAQDIRDRCEKTRGCVVEIILKDVMTCRQEPWRLTEWTRIAQQIAEEYV